MTIAQQDQRVPNMEEIQKSYHDIAEMIGVKLAPENDPSKAFLQVQKGKS